MALAGGSNKVWVVAQMAMKAGVAYQIVVDGFNGQFGPYRIDITAIEVPHNASVSVCVVHRCQQPAEAQQMQSLGICCHAVC